MLAHITWLSKFRGIETILCIVSDHKLIQKLEINGKTQKLCKHMEIKETLLPNQMSYEKSKEKFELY